MDRLIVSELFGPTVQGEGPSTGVPAMFVRLGLCNLDCHVCDTPYTWDWTGKNGPPQDRNALVHMPVHEVVARITERCGPARLVVITGGEPLVQAAGVRKLADALIGQGFDVEVETNGTLAPPLSAPGLRYNVSPKLSAMLHDAAQREVPGALAEFLTPAYRGRVAWKFVLANPTDLPELDAFVARHQLPPHRVWLMPEGTTVTAQVVRLPWLAEAAIQRGMNLTARLHVLAWGNERGR